MKEGIHPTYVEAKVVCPWAELSPMRQRRFEQDIGADDVGVDELGRAIDRAIDMAFGREMHDPVWIKACEGVSDCGAVANVRAAEMIARIAVRGSK